MDRVACPKCGHPVAEHQPSYAANTYHKERTVGCSICDCILTLRQKLLAWGR